MRKTLFAIFTGSVTMIPQMAPAQQQAPAAAPTTTAPAQPSVSSTATLADCDRLLVVLEQKRPANPGVTAEQVQAYKTGNNPQACRDALMRVDPDFIAGKTEGGTNIVVQQPAPSVQVEQAAPQVTVQQPQPQVTVRQPQPEILVRQPAPTVTIEIPQPEITVRMPKPEVNVAMAQPQVQVNQPPPNVQVTQPQQPQVQVQPSQPQVNLQQTGPSANVQVQENNAPPTVRFERAEPKVIINQAQGEPQVRMESADAGPQGGSQSGTSAPRTTGVRNDQGMTVAKLKTLYLYNARGSRLGDVERVVEGQDRKQFVVVGVGGFLGIGERHVAIPIENVVFRSDRLLLEGVSDDQLKSMPAFDRNNRALREVQANATVQISSR